MHISKEGDPYLRTLLVQGAHHILGPFGADSDLRRWGPKLRKRGKEGEETGGGREGAKAGRVAASLVGERGGIRSPRNTTSRAAGSRIVKIHRIGSTAPQRRVPVTALMAWPNFHREMEREVENQVAAPAATRTPNLHRAEKIAH